MDSNIHYRQLNPIHGKNSSMSKFWSQKHNVLPEGMPQKLNYQKRYMKHMVDLLHDETHKDRRKKIFYNKLINEDEDVSSSGVKVHLSKNVQKMLKKISKNVDHIKNSIIDITKMNGLYLEDRAKKTFFRTHQVNNGSLNFNNKNNSELDIKRMKAIKKMNFRKTQSDLNIRGNKNYLNNNEENNNKDNNSNKDNNQKDQKKDDYTKNFVYVNDNYRRQLNFAFLKYNADQHLENIKFLVQADPDIREDINNIVQEVQNDIEWKCDKKHFAKKYFNIKERYDRLRNIRLLNEKEKEKDNQVEIAKLKDNLLPKIKDNKNLKYKTNTKTFRQKSIGNIYHKLNYGLKYNKKELNKLNAQKEQTEEEINHMLIASKEIDDFIQDENINNKIDMFKTDYARKMYGYYQPNESKNNLLEKDYFLEQKENIVNKIGNVFSFKMDKTTNDQEKMFKGKIYDEAKKFRKRIVDGKKNALDEFNGYITTYQIKLPEEKSETKNGLNTNQTSL